MPRAMKSSDQQGGGIAEVAGAGPSEISYAGGRNQEQAKAGQARRMSDPTWR